MEEHYEDYLRNKFEMDRMQRAQSRNPHFIKEVKRQYHHSPGSIARALSEKLKDTVTDVVFTGIRESEITMSDTGNIVSVSYAQYQGVSKWNTAGMNHTGPFGMKVRGEIPLCLLNPQDYKISHMRKARDTQ